MAQMKEQIKAPEIIQLSTEETANLSDAQFKTLVIRKLTELVEFGRKLDEKMKATQRIVYREPTVKGRKRESNQWCGQEGRKKHPTRKE